MRIRTHAAGSSGGEFFQGRNELPLAVEEFVRPITPHPFLEQLEMGRIADDIGDRDLVCAPKPLDPMAIDFFWRRPTLGGAQDYHWPSRARSRAALASLILNRADLDDASIKSRGHLLVHDQGIAAFDHV